MHMNSAGTCFLFKKKKNVKGVELDLGTICSIEQRESSPTVNSVGLSCSKH